MKLAQKVKSIVASKNFLRIFLVVILIFNLGIAGIVLADSTSQNSSQATTYTTLNGTAADYNFWYDNGTCQFGGGAHTVLSGAQGILIGDTGVFDATYCNVYIPNGGASPKAEDQQKAFAAVRNYMAKDQGGGGLLGVVTTANTFLLQQRPASGVDYVQDRVYALTHPGQIYAATIPNNDQSANAKYYQGTGFDLLTPIRGFWGWAVKIVFAIMILVIIVIAFLIMFRQKLPGGVEVTIQNSIPAIALALVLIPFSYAISGLFIDLITLGTNVTHDALIGPGSPGQSVFDNRGSIYTSPLNYIGNTPQDRGLYPDDTRVTVFNLRDNVDITQQVKAFGNTLGFDSNGLFQIITNILNFFTGKNGTTGTNSYWVGSILNLILSLLMIYIGVKIFAHLFVKYLFIILFPIYSPFVFATVAIPGNGAKTLGIYLRALFSATCAYVATYLLFLLTLIFTNSAFQNSIPDIKSGTFIPPLLGISDLLGGTSNKSFANLLFSLVGIGIYFSIPELLNQIDVALNINDKLIRDIIGTPLNALKESANVTFKGAPAFAARATQITAGGVRRIAQAGVSTPLVNAGRLWDRARGLTDSDPDSTFYKTTQRYQTRRQNLLNELDSIQGNGDPASIAKRARLTGQLRAQDAEESLLGFSTKGEEGKDRKIETSNVEFTFDSNAYAALRNRSENGYYIFRIGTLVIKPVNFNFPTAKGPDGKPVSALPVIFGGIKLGSDGRKILYEDPKGADAIKEPYFPTWNSAVGLLPPGDPNRKDSDFDVFNSALLEFKGGGPLTAPDPANPGSRKPVTLNSRILAGTNFTQNRVGVEGKNIGIPIFFVIDQREVVTIFGGTDFAGASTDALIRAGLRTKERKVKIGAYETDEFRVIMTRGTQ